MHRKLFAAVTLLAAPAAAETFDIRARIFCPPNDAYCSQNNFAQLRDDWRRQVAEINLEFRPTGYSFRPLDPIVTVDARLAGLTNTSGTSATGDDNAAIVSDLLDVADDAPGEITLLLVGDPDKCWNGVPCPGSDLGFDGDDVVFCGLPRGDSGRTYAHELGHFWCLRHTFSGADGMYVTEADHDYDADVCPELGVLVDDTPPDPLRRERGERVGDAIPEWHDYCDATQNTGVDAGSPHASMCDVTCYRRLGGVDVELTQYAPMTENAMSYYDSGECRGPFVVGGERFEAFTEAQADVVHACRELIPLRASLVDVCANRGGDTDHDGWCDLDDVCLFVPNTDLANADGDAFPDACDLCPFTAAVSNTDLDGDGQGDACDADDDNDGCTDGTDQNPTQASVPVGSFRRPLCNPEYQIRYGFQGDDTDGDGRRNCTDTDDDNDGISDGSDTCPLQAGTGCHTLGAPCGEQSPFARFQCRLGGCNELLVRLVDAVNPDPTRAVVFEKFSIVNEVLYVTPLAGKTLSETAMHALSAPALPSRLGRNVAVELMSKRTGARVARLFTFEPDDAGLGDVRSGRMLALFPPAGGAAARIAGVWSEGAAPGRVPADAEADRVPDFADNCTGAANARQTDTDRDGFGDACDPDFDQDHRVERFEVQRVEQCAGVDLVRPLALDDDTILTRTDKLLLTRRATCEGTDLNGDRRVDAVDARIARGLLDRRPGPSAFR